MSNDNSLPTVVGADLCNVLNIASQRIGNTVSDMDFQFHVIQRTANSLLKSADSLPPAMVSDLQNIIQAADAGRAAKKTISK
jgi:hypothetical protein